MGISTHVLDTALGCPAQGVPVSLARADDEAGFVTVTEAMTDADGRVSDLLAGTPLSAGIWRVEFGVGAYHRATGQRGFYPTVPVIFEVTDPAAHHHVPCLLSPWGYSTYRGS